MPATEPESTAPDAQPFTEAFLASHMKLPIGVLFVKEDCSIVWSNSLANSILAMDDGLYKKNQKIKTCALSYDSCPIQNAVQRISCNGHKEETVLIERAKSNAPYFVRIFPSGMSAQKLMTLHISGRYIVDMLSATNLKLLFGLTEAEAKIALHISKGLGTKDCQKILNVSRETIRTHLRNIHAKLNINSQSELASYVLTSLPSLYV